MREYAREKKIMTARFHCRSCSLSLYKYLYIDKEYMIFILVTYTMRKFKKDTTPPYCSVSPSLTLVIALKVPVH